MSDIPAFDTLIGLSHNTMKPIALFEWCLLRYAKQGYNILDCFAGRGTTALAIQKLNIEKKMKLTCTLIDNNIDYCNVMICEIERERANLKNEFYLKDMDLFNRS